MYVCPVCHTRSHVASACPNDGTRMVLLADEPSSPRLPAAHASQRMTGARASSGQQPMASGRMPSGPAAAPMSGPVPGRAPSGPRPVSSSAVRARSPQPRVSSPAPRALEPMHFEEEGTEHQILGNYRLLDMLGKGGMGMVYRAENIMLGRKVALKLLAPELTRRRDAVARFFQEARTVIKARHRNIVDVLDLVELESGHAFIVMELLNGKPLSTWIMEARGDTPRILRLMMQICDALAAAHQVGVVHRDLKPDNIMVVHEPGEEGEIAKILDFGIAKLTDGDSTMGVKTTEGFVMGTPAFMAPEQACGQPVDGRTDLYSLGVIMYELFTGQPLFRAKNMAEFAYKHVAEEPVPPRHTPGGAEMDPALERVILRCLAKQAEDRYASTLELKAAIGALLPAMQGGLVGSGGMPLVNLAAGGSGFTPSQPIAISARNSLQVGTAAHTQPNAATFPGMHTTLTTGPVVLESIPASKQRRSRRYALLVGVPLVVAGMAGAGFGLYQRGGGAAAASEQGAASAGATPSVVRLESRPQADVYLEGETAPSCSTPCDLPLPRDHMVQHVILRAEGYEPEILPVDTLSPQGSVIVRMRPRAVAHDVGTANGPSSGADPGSAEAEAAESDSAGSSARSKSRHRSRTSRGSEASGAGDAATHTGEAEQPAPEQSTAGESATASTQPGAEQPRVDPGTGGKTAPPDSTASAPADSKSGGKSGPIDQSQIINPFKRKNTGGSP